MAKQTSKTAYSFGNNLIYMLKNMWAHSRRYTFMAFFQAPFGVLEALLTIYLSGGGECHNAGAGALGGAGPNCADWRRAFALRLLKKIPVCAYGSVYGGSRHPL